MFYDVSIFDFEIISKLKRSDYKNEGTIPIIDQGEKFISGYTNQPLPTLPKQEYIIFGDHSESIKYVDFSFVQGADGLKILKVNNHLTKYIYYAFQNFYIKTFNYKRHWTSAKNTLIPIPCPDQPEKSLEIQTKIANILDKFSELTAEYNMRRKQSQYFRDKLLCINDKNYLGEKLKNLISCVKNIKWNSTIKNYEYIDLTSVDILNHQLTYTTVITKETALSRAQQLLETDDVIFAITRPTQQRYCIINNAYSGSIASTGYCVLRANKNFVLPKWIFHNMGTTNFKIFLENNQSGSAYPAISNSLLQEYKIPLPPLSEQARIVSILDKFDALTNSITEGLPREIELRKKQYEYYRDLLFDFPRIQVK